MKKNLSPSQMNNVMHHDRQRQENFFQNPDHSPLHTPITNSAAFSYRCVEDLMDVFQNKQKGYSYARQSNPTNKSLEDKITILENGIETISFSSGMAAIGSIFFALLKKGDHIVVSKFLFGNTRSLFTSFERFGIQVSFIDVTSVKNVEKAITKKTKIIFYETIANPIMQVADLVEIGKLAFQKKIVSIVDSTMTTPLLFSAGEVKATFVLHSLTKYFSGHANSLGGSITDLGNFDWQEWKNILPIYKNNKNCKSVAMLQIRKKGLRDFGASLSAFHSHLISVAMETMELRVHRQCHNALTIAQFLESHPKVEKVNYPGLENHPQHVLAKEVFKDFGAILSFDLKKEIDIKKFLNRFKKIVLCTNLGDVRTLAIPVASTIFYEAGKEKRTEMGIQENTIRLSVGIEEIDFILEDISRGLGE